MAAKWDNLFRLLVKVLKHNNWHFLHSYGSITMETATKPGSLNFDSKYFLTLRDGGKGGRRTISTPLLPPERCLGACVCHSDYGLCFICIADPKEISPSKKKLTAKLISIYGLLQKSNFSPIKGRRQRSACRMTPVPWDTSIFHNQNTMWLKISALCVDGSG